MDNHLAEWVDSCDELKIPITAKGAEEAAARHRQRRDHTPPPASQPDEGRAKFSHEAFVNAIVEWIVSDDQVCTDLIHVHFSFYYYFSSHLRSLRTTS